MQMEKEMCDYIVKVLILEAAAVKTSKKR